MIGAFLTWLFGYRAYWLTLPSCLVEVNVPAWWRKTFADALYKQVEKDFKVQGYAIYPVNIRVHVHPLRAEAR